MSIHTHGRKLACHNTLSSGVYAVLIDGIYYFINRKSQRGLQESILERCSSRMVDGKKKGNQS